MPDATDAKQCRRRQRCQELGRVDDKLMRGALRRRAVRDSSSGVTHIEVTPIDLHKHVRTRCQGFVVWSHPYQHIQASSRRSRQAHAAGKQAQAHTGGTQPASTHRRRASTRRHTNARTCSGKHTHAAASTHMQRQAKRRRQAHTCSGKHMHTHTHTRRRHARAGLTPAAAPRARAHPTTPC